MIVEQGAYSLEDVDTAMAVGKTIVELTDMGEELRSGALEPQGDISALGSQVYDIDGLALSPHVKLSDRSIERIYDVSSRNRAAVTIRLSARNMMRSAGQQALRLKALKMVVPGPEFSTRAVDLAEGVPRPSIYTRLNPGRTAGISGGGKTIPAFGPSLGSVSFSAGGAIPHSAIVSDTTGNRRVDDRSGGAGVEFIPGSEQPGMDAKFVVISRDSKFRFGEHFKDKLLLTRGIRDADAYKRSLETNIFGQAGSTKRRVVLETASRFPHGGAFHIFGRGRMDVMHSFRSNGRETQHTDRLVFVYVCGSRESDMSKFMADPGDAGIVITFIPTMIALSNPASKIEAVGGHSPMNSSHHVREFSILTPSGSEPTEEDEEVARSINVQAALHDPYLLLPYHLLYTSFDPETGFSEGGIGQMDGKYSVEEGTNELVHFNCVHYGGVEIEDVMHMGEEKVQEYFRLFLNYIIRKHAPMSPEGAIRVLRALFSSSSCTKLHDGKVGLMKDTAVSNLGTYLSDIDFTMEMHCVRLLLNRFYKTHSNAVYSKMMTKADLQAAHIPLSVFDRGIRFKGHLMPSGFAVTFACSPVLDLLNKFNDGSPRPYTQHSLAGTYAGVVHSGMTTVRDNTVFTVFIEGIGSVGLDDLAAGMVSVVEKSFPMLRKANPTAARKGCPYVMYHPEFAFIIVASQVNFEAPSLRMYFIDHPRASSIVPSMNNTRRLLHHGHHVGTTAYLGNMGYGLLVQKRAAIMSTAEDI
jgi:hypothetical protein